MITTAKIVFYILIFAFIGGVYLFRRNKWRIAMLCTLALIFATATGNLHMIGLESLVGHINRMRILSPEIVLIQQLPTFTFYFVTISITALACIIFVDKAPYAIARANAIVNASSFFISTTAKSRIVSFNRIGFVLRN